MKLPLKSPWRCLLARRYLESPQLPASGDAATKLPVGLIRPARGPELALPRTNGGYLESPFRSLTHRAGGSSSTAEPSRLTAGDGCAKWQGRGRPARAAMARPGAGRDTLAGQEA